MRRGALTAFFLATLAIAHLARAQVDAPGQQPAVNDRPENGYWSQGAPRLFVSARPEFGTPYAKPYVSVGYGLPHWLWAGVDVNAISTFGFFQAYGGVRAASPLLDLAFGLRDTWSFDKRYMPRADVHTSDDVSRGPGPRVRYLAWEGEAVGTVPLPHAALIADFILVRTIDVPADVDMFDESYRAIVRKPLFFTLRVAPVVRLLNENALRGAVLTEIVFGTGRGRPVVRVGPALSLQLTDHLEANLALTLAVASPDRLGLAMGAYGIAGLRYRWATGERRPEAPWSGHFIPW